jgi:endonuclease/exonuclease/phosphatase family metal-dependent hydrolase
MALSIATFNVKNLLEPRTPAAAAILPLKLDAIAAMLQRCDADVAGLQEIGSLALLSGVLERLDARAPYVPIMGTVDARGIGCAVLSRVPVLASQVHTSEALPFPVFRDGDPPPFGARIPLRRGVVQVRVRAEGLGKVEVFVAHFKSGRAVGTRDVAGIERRPSTPRERSEADLRSQVWRASEALFVRGRVDDVLGREPGAMVAVVGDLNDRVDSWAVRALRSDGTGEAEGALLDASTSVPSAARFTHFHGGRRAQIDHVLVTAALKARIVDALVLNDSLREHEPLPESGAEAEEEEPTADSDHAPLVVRFG